MPWERGFEAQAPAERQPRAGFKCVLHKKREDDVAIVLERTPALREGAEAAEQKVGRGGAGVVASEAVSAVLEQVVVMVETGALERAADREIMPAFDPPHGIVPVERRACEHRIGKRAEAEEA